MELRNFVGVNYYPIDQVSLKFKDSGDVVSAYPKRFPTAMEIFVYFS